MRVAILSSEVVPFAKTGGLADVTGALPKALRNHDVEAIVLLPLYQQVDRSLLKEQVLEDVPIEWRGNIRLTRVFQSDATGAPAYLIDAPEYFSRSSIYGFQDDHERFAFFGRAACPRLDIWIGNLIVHCHDWPGGFPTIDCARPL